MEHTISAAQFFAVQFLIRVTMTIALDPSAIAGENPLNTLLSYGLAMVLGAGLAVPVWLLHRQPGMAFGEQAAGGAGVAAPPAAGDGLWGAGAPGPGSSGTCGGPVLHLIFCGGQHAVPGGVSGTAGEAPPPAAGGAPPPGIPLGPDSGSGGGGGRLRRVAGPGDHRPGRGLPVCAGPGRDGAAVRHGGRALPVGEPSTAGGRPDVAGRGRVFLSRTSLFAEMAVLLPYVRGRRGLGFALWSLGTTVFVAALTLLLAGCLGPYAATQDFPVYTLASLSEVASLQRLEPVFAVLWMAGLLPQVAMGWMAGLLPQVAMGLYACRVCAASLGGNRPPWVIVPAALGMAALGLWAVSSKGVQSAFQDSSLWLTLTLLTGGGVPLVLWLLNKLRRKGARP